MIDLAIDDQQTVEDIPLVLRDKLDENQKIDQIFKDFDG